MQSEGNDSIREPVALGDLVHFDTAANESKTDSLCMLEDAMSLPIAIIVLSSQLCSIALAVVPLSDAAITRILYDGPKVPPGFHWEATIQNGDNLSTVAWVRRGKDTKSNQLQASAHTSDEALKLTREMMRRDEVSPKERIVVARKKTDQYFQYTTRKVAAGHTYFTHYRVWRADYFQPAGAEVQTFLPASTARVGTLTVKRFPKAVREFAEMLWWNEFHDVKGAVVLAPSVLTERAESIQVTMPVAFMAFGDWNMKDQARVQEWTLSVERRTGSVTRSFHTTKIIECRQNPPAISK